MPWTNHDTRQLARKAEAEWRKRKQEEAMFDICKPLPPNTAAKEAAARAWSKFDRMAAMVARAESECCAGNDSAMCGELEDLERMVAEVLRGPKEAA